MTSGKIVIKYCASAMVERVNCQPSDEIIVIINNSSLAFFEFCIFAF